MNENENYFYRMMKNIFSRPEIRIQFRMKTLEIETILKEILAFFNEILRLFWYQI